MIYICNAFSLSMLDRGEQDLAQRIQAAGLCALDDAEWTAVQSAGYQPRVRIPSPITLQHARALLAGETVVSAVGHADTAGLLGGLLGIDLQPARISVRLAHGDLAIVGQYVGPRLPEGCTVLPDGASIEWWLV